jgi:hypothetical protein
MQQVTLKLKPGIHESHSSIPPLTVFPDELIMNKDDTYYWPLEPNNSHGTGKKFGDTVGILHEDIERHYNVT